MAGRGSIGVDKGGALGIGRTALDREVYCFVHHLGGGRALAVGGHCLFHPSIISRYPRSTSMIAARIPSPRVPLWKTSPGSLPPLRVYLCISLKPWAAS